MTHLTAILSSVLLAGALSAQTPEVGKRAETQQARVANGVKTGALKPGETRRIERRETAIHKEVKTERKVNGGALTGNERRAVNRQDNKMSRNIAVDKHNAATAKPDKQ